jgi:hypothetical protein
LPIRNVDVRFDLRVQAYTFNVSHYADNLCPQRYVRPPIKLSRLARIQPPLVNPLADGVLVGETPLCQGFGKDGDPRGFQRVALGEGATSQYGYAHGAEIIRADALKTDARIIVFSAGLPVFNGDPEAGLVAGCGDRLDARLIFQTLHQFA